MTVSCDQVLGASYDLSNRPAVGDLLQYRVEACYRYLDDAGLVGSRESFVGVCTRTVEALTAEGPEETIVWTDVHRRTAVGDEPWEEVESLDWANGVTYRFSSDIGLADLYKCSDGFPRDLLGWNVLLLFLDAHVEFDFPRWTRFGINDLNRVGDEVTTVDDDVFVIDFPPIRAEFAGGIPYVTRFQGLTTVSNASCAILEIDIGRRNPLSMQIGDAEFSGTSTVWRQLSIRLSDGVVECGTSVEWVLTNGMVINPTYSIQRLSDDDATSGF